MSHPYSELERTHLWKAVETALNELERNQDIALSTTRQHVVGYLCKRLLDQRVVVSGVSSNAD